MAADGEFIDEILDKYKYLYIPTNSKIVAISWDGWKTSTFDGTERMEKDVQCTPYILNTAAESRYKSRGKLD